MKNLQNMIRVSYLLLVASLLVYVESVVLLAEDAISDAGRIATKDSESILINTKADGYRGIWYWNQRVDNDSVFKYSGGMATYCAKHRPIAVYAPEVDKTFFCFGGTDAKNSTLYHMVSYYDHKTKMVPQPTVLLDKKTDDAHDNPVISIDDKGFIWVFSPAHGTSRPSYISVSTEPYSIDEFRLVKTMNFSYPQPFYVKDQGFLFAHTIYVKGHRTFQFMKSKDGVEWTEPKCIANIDDGHYQISEPFKNKKFGSAFNYHPDGLGLNFRTNLYFVQTEDAGETWTSVDGKKLKLPLVDVQNPALVVDYESKDLKVYLKDLSYDKEGNPIILYLISHGWIPGADSGPQIWKTARWTGTEWDIQGNIESDHNYDMGSLYVEEDGTWRIIVPTENSPQAFNAGGEMVIWVSKDLGQTWKKEKQLTANSKLNHTYARRPVNANPEFYAIWGDGHGRQVSDCRLYFCDKAGEHVYQLPMHMESKFAKPKEIEAYPRVSEHVSE